MPFKDDPYFKDTTEYYTKSANDSVANPEFKVHRLYK